MNQHMFRFGVPLPGTTGTTLAEAPTLTPSEDSRTMARYHPFHDEVLDDPHPFYRQLRDEAPAWE